MNKADVRTIQTQLGKIAWPLVVDGELGPTTRRAIRKFEDGFAGPGGPLDGNGTPNARTRHALEWAVEHGGACSKHFRYREFASKGNGDVIIVRALIVSLERLRDDVGHPLSIVSGYRDPLHNQVIGGARFSQHLYGCASDLPEGQRVSIAEATKAGFSGIGYDEDNGFVEHVDVRHAGPNNTTGAHPGAPTKWVYS